MWEYKPNINEYETPESELAHLQGYLGAIRDERIEIIKQIRELRLAIDIDNSLKGDEKRKVAREETLLKNQKKRLSSRLRSVTNKIYHMKQLLKDKGTPYEKGRKFIRKSPN